MSVCYVCLSGMCMYVCVCVCAVCMCVCVQYVCVPDNCTFLEQVDVPEGLYRSRHSGVCKNVSDLLS